MLRLHAEVSKTRQELESPGTLTAGMFSLGCHHREGGREGQETRVLLSTSTMAILVNRRATAQPTSPSSSYSDEKCRLHQTPQNKKPTRPKSLVFYPHPPNPGTSCASKLNIIKNFFQTAHLFYYFLNCSLKILISF